MTHRTPILGLLLLGACPLGAQNIGDPTGDPGTTAADQTSNQTSGPSSSPTSTTLDELTGEPDTTGGINQTEVGTSTSDTTAVDTTAIDTTAVDTATVDTTTGTTAECTPTGDALESAECLAIDPDRPFCQGDTCVPCGALGPDACVDATAGARPVCLPAGACVACDTPDPMLQGQCSSDAPHCNLETNTCEGCQEHSECPETACEVAAGKCFPTDKIIYVRQGPSTPEMPCSVTPGSGGTMEKPYCTFEIAIAGVQLGGFSTGYTFHLLANDAAPGDPESVIITGGDVPVAYAFTHDPGSLLDKHTRFKDIGPLILVPDNVTLYLRSWGLLVEGQSDSSRGIDCQSGGAVWLDDSRVLYARGAGIRGDNCDIHLRRSTIAFGSTEAIDMTGGSLHTVNSVIAENSNLVGKRGGGLHLAGEGTTVDILYTTIVNNSNEPSQMPGQLGDSIHCDTSATVTVRNSIIARRPEGTNPSLVCPDSNVTVDWSVIDFDFMGDNNKVAAEDILVGLTSDGLTGAYRVNAMGEPLFSEQARWQSGDPFFDIDLTPRNAVVDGPDYAGSDVYLP